MAIDGRRLGLKIGKCVTGRKRPNHFATDILWHLNALIPENWREVGYPDVFCAALINSQPMGFYSVAQIVTDAGQHGVEVRPVCVNASR